MWISKKTAMVGQDVSGGCTVGKVTVGGSSPAVMTDGEVRNAQVAMCGGGVYLPKSGDVVAVGTTGDGENIILGRLEAPAESGADAGEVYITTEGGGSVIVHKNGEIELRGTVRLVGTTYITGELYINGTKYVPAS